MSFKDLLLREYWEGRRHLTCEKTESNPLVIVDCYVILKHMSWSLILLQHGLTPLHFL